MLKKKKGFTLVEVIVVLVILAVLIAIAVPSIFKYIDDAEDARILAQARPVLNASKAEAVKLYAEGTLNTLPNDEELHTKIIEIAEIDGQLIKIDLNKTKTSSGDFVVKIQDRYVYYNDKKQTFEFVDGADYLNIIQKVNDALLTEDIKKEITGYFEDRKNTYKLDSEGPNFGSKIKEKLAELGFDSDAYSFRIWSKDNNNSITIGTPKLTSDMINQQVEVTRYDYGSSSDFSSTPKIYTAKVSVILSSTKDTNGNDVTFPAYKLDDAQWVEQE